MFFNLLPFTGGKPVKSYLPWPDYRILVVLTVSFAIARNQVGLGGGIRNSKVPSKRVFGIHAPCLTLPGCQQSGTVWMRQKLTTILNIRRSDKI